MSSEEHHSQKAQLVKWLRQSAYSGLRTYDRYGFDMFFMGSSQSLLADENMHAEKKKKKACIRLIALSKCNGTQHLDGKI